MWSLPPSIPLRVDFPSKLPPGLVTAELIVEPEPAPYEVGFDWLLNKWLLWVVPPPFVGFFGLEIPGASSVCLRGGRCLCSDLRLRPMGTAAKPLNKGPFLLSP